MKTELPDELSQYVHMNRSAQQFYKEAAACREEASRSLNRAGREASEKFAREWEELALAAERGQIFRRG